MLILGGAARVLGPIVGSVVFWFMLVFIDGALANAVSSGAIDFIRSSDQVGQIRTGSRARPDAPDDLPTAGDPGRQEGALSLDAR